MMSAPTSLLLQHPIAGKSAPAARPAHPLAYRKDIDGLRALAVLPVMLYHAGIPGFSGGFIGVDVFLVISGFLITSILLKDLTEDRFSLATFYERRGRRILPALTAVVFFSVAASFWLSMASSFRSFTRSVLWLSFFSSNILFKSEFGYFDAEAHTKPLLHTWSLSVEEQFYLFFPILLFLGWKYARRRLGTLLIALATISLAASYFGLKRDPSAAFYFIHYRAWELALGSLLALALHPAAAFRLPQLPQAGREAFAGLGLAGILLPTFFYTQQTRFPGLAALPPCLGAFLLVWANTGRPTLVGKLLSTRPAVQIGLMSYSLYLWHWPLLVFGKLYRGEDLTKVQGALVLLASLPVSWLSLRFIERPFREKRLLPRRRHVLACSVAVLLITGSIGFAFSRKNSAIDRMRIAVSAAGSDQATASLLEDPRPNDQTSPNEKFWQIVDGHVYMSSIGDLSKPGILVIGDSFANHWRRGLELFAEKNGLCVHLQYLSSCLPLIDTYIPEVEVKYRLPGRKRNASFGLIIDRTQVKHVVLAGSWKPYTDQQGPLGVLNTLYQGDRHSSTMAEQRELVSRQLEETIRFCNAKGCKVWVVLPPPDFPYNVPLKLASLVRSHRSIRESYISRDEALKRRASTCELLAQVVSRHSKTEVEFLDPFDYFCSDGMCITVQDNRSLYYDDAHLSYYGSIHGIPVFQPVADELKRTRSDATAKPGGM